jgi:hypothetical protein
MAPPKNKAFLITKLIELDKTLDENELSKKTVIELTRMKMDMEKVEEPQKKQTILNSFLEWLEKED